MDLKNKVLEFADREGLFDTELIVVGVSGGSDSVALLSVLSSISNRNSTDDNCDMCNRCGVAYCDFPRICAVHVNHGIRTGAADDDERLVVKLCESLNVPLKIYRYDVLSMAKEMKKSVEETGRILRYRAFDDYAKELLGDDFEARSRIAVAHHMDDAAETMLMNIFRGCGTDGLCAPTPINGRVIRPLLCVEKEELIDYLNDRKLLFAHDYTNDESDCTRNFFRNEVLTLIKSCAIKDPNKALNDTRELVSMDAQYLSGVADAVFEKNYDSELKTLPSQVVANEHRAIGSRLVRKLWTETFGNRVDFAKAHTDAMLELSSNETSDNTTVDLPFGRIGYKLFGNIGYVENDGYISVLEASVKRRGFVLSSCENGLTISIENSIGAQITTNLPDSDVKMELQIVENMDSLEYNCYSWFYPISKDIASTEIVLQSGHTDLVFNKAGSVSRKKLSRLFIDSKVPSQLRNRISYIVVDDEIVWIPGVGHASGFVNSVSRVRAQSDKNAGEDCLVLRLRFLFGNTNGNKEKPNGL